MYNVNRHSVQSDRHSVQCKHSVQSDRTLQCRQTNYMCVHCLHRETRCSNNWETVDGIQTFSNFSFTGLGFMAVTFSVISLPTRNASSFDAPFSSTNKLQKQMCIMIFIDHCHAYSPISVPIHNPCPPLRCWVDQLDCTLQCFPPFLHNTVCNFHTWHSPGEICSCVPISNIGDHLQPQLSSIQHLPKCLEWNNHLSCIHPLSACRGLWDPEFSKLSIPMGIGT